MAGPAETFRDIHRLRRHAKQLQAEIDRGPRLLKTQQAKIARQEELHRESQETIKHLKVTIHEKEVSLKATYTIVAKHEKQLNEAAGKKEYDALKSEIAAERAKGATLENEILDAMAEMEDRAAKLPESEKAVQQAKQEYSQVEANAQSRLTGLTQQLEETRQKLKEVEASLPEELRAQYERLIAARGEDALSAMHGRTCEACYTEITAQNYNDLLAGRMVFCKACGRIVYLSEQATA